MIIWYYEGVQITMSTASRNITSSSVQDRDTEYVNVTSELTFPMINRADDGEYMCIAMNTVVGESRNDTESFNVTVNCELLCVL